MKIYLIVTCCLGLACIATAADQQQDQQGHKRKGQKSAPTNQPVAPQRSARLQHVQRGQLQGNPNAYRNLNSSKSNAYRYNVHNAHVTNKVVVNQHFNLASRPNRNIPRVTFRSGVHIAGSHAWLGPKYVVFRNYSPVWHDRDWWISNHPHIVFVFGAPYYWDAGYWQPAWGYDPNATYYYDGPIYAASPEVDPSQEVAQVQSVLRDQGYYNGDIDGVLGPLTRAAIATYQQEHGLYTTSTLDQPTLESLGLA